LNSNSEKLEIELFVQTRHSVLAAPTNHQSNHSTMFNSASIVLIIDRDRFSSANISNDLRKLGLARNTVCLKSALDALAYLEKQLTCGYPFPEFIFYSPHRSDLNQAEFMELYRIKFSDRYNSKVILIQKKSDERSGRRLFEDSLIQGELRKPLSSGQLLRIFQKEMKERVPR